MLYITSSDNKARFALGKLGTKNLVIFGVNPSMATDTKFDRTIRRVEGYSGTHGFDGWLMLNLYPQRATDPADLHTECDDSLHAENIAVIGKSLREMSNFTLCAAWGGVIEVRKYLSSCMAEIAATLAPHPWHSIGAPTKTGHPRHPLYVPKAANLQPFNVEEYQLLDQ